MNKLISTAIVSGLLITSAIAAEDTTTVTPEATTVEPAAITMNPAQPGFMLGMMNPVSHQAFHKTMQNPASWTQFSQPAFYMQMANPANAMAWMNPAVYQSMMNPATFMSWMNPTMVMNMATDLPVPTAMNPMTFMGMMNPAMAQTGTQMNPVAGMQNMFGMGAWSGMFQPATPKAEPQTEDQG